MLIYLSICLLKNSYNQTLSNAQFSSGFTILNPAPKFSVYDCRLIAQSTPTEKNTRISERRTAKYWSQLQHREGKILNGRSIPTAEPRQALSLTTTWSVSWTLTRTYTNQFPDGMFHTFLPDNRMFTLTHPSGSTGLAEKCTLRQLFYWYKQNRTRPENLVWFKACSNGWTLKFSTLILATWLRGN